MDSVSDSPENSISDETPVAAPAVSLTKQQRELMQSHLIASKFGNMVTVMMQSPHHGRIALSELRDRLVPPLLNNQYRLAEAHKKGSGSTIPVGLILWARVSDEVHKRMLEGLDKPFELKANEWQGGENYWIIDAIGQERFLSPLLSDLRKKEFKGKSVQYRARSDNGPEVRTIDETTPDGDEGAPSATIN